MKIVHISRIFLMTIKMTLPRRKPVKIRFNRWEVLVETLVIKSPNLGTLLLCALKIKVNKKQPSIP